VDLQNLPYHLKLGEINQTIVDPQGLVAHPDGRATPNDVLMLSEAKHLRVTQRSFASLRMKKHQIRMLNPFIFKICIHLRYLWLFSCDKRKPSKKTASILLDAVFKNS
jgi:hypothetical protein